jgi:hypothetical protein
MRKTWTQWKASARLADVPRDQDIILLRNALLSAAQTTGPQEIERLRRVVGYLKAADLTAAIAASEDRALMFHYRFWGQPGRQLGMRDVDESFRRLSQNPSVLSDLEEVLTWAGDESRVGTARLNLPFPCPLELHATYGNDEIKAALGGATLESAGVTGVGRLHFPNLKTLVSLVTYQKSEKEFSPSTMYQDYPISRDLLHWETQSQTSQASETGQNLVHHKERGYIMLFFARARKKIDGVTEPFTFLGPAQLVSYRSERPIQMVWRLDHPMPAQMFEDNRRGG